MASPETSAMPMIDHAVNYIRAGLPVFPVCTPLMVGHKHRYPDTLKMVTCPKDRIGKVPLVRWRGYQNQLPTEDEVRGWWRQWPDANIGLCTGELSGLLVLDADGTEARKECLKNGGLDETPMIWTGKIGAAHFYLTYPGGDVRNFARKMPGTDMRAQGGYVLMPPSLHSSGQTYRWNENTRHFAYAPVPEWLMGLIESDSAEGEDSVFGEDFDIGEVLEGIPQGKRDDTLYRYACRLRHDDVPRAQAVELLRLAARACKPAFDEAVAIGKVRRAYEEFQPAQSPTVDDDGWFRPPGSTLDPPITGTIDLDNETDEASTGWRVYNAEDFLAIEYPPIEWRIEGYLREKAIMFSFGPPGSIKTYVATDAGLAIASGGLFLGRFASQQGRVLIVQEDTLGSDYQQAYLRPMIAARGITGKDVRDTLFIAPPGDFSFDQQERLQDLCLWLKEYTPNLLVVDSFYLMYSGKKEDLINVMKLLKKIRNKYGCAIWIIDHNRKSQGAGSVGEDAIDRLINGREKSAAVDVVMESRSVKGESGSVFLDVLKQRGVKLPEALRVTYDDGRLTIDGDEEESPKGAAQAVYEWLCREGGSRTKTQIARGCDLSERSVHYATGELFVNGLAHKTGKQGRSDLWIAVRKANAEPPRHPNIDFDGGFSDV